MISQREIDRIQQEWLEGMAVSPCLHVGCGQKPIAGAVNVDANPDRWAWADTACDAHRLPFPDGAFRSVVSSHVLEHLQEPVAALCELARVLRLGGAMSHIVPDHRYTPHRVSVRHPFAHHHHEWEGPAAFRDVVRAVEEIASVECISLESFAGFHWSFRVVFVKVGL